MRVHTAQLMARSTLITEPGATRKWTFRIDQMGSVHPRGPRGESLSRSPCASPNCLPALICNAEPTRPTGTAPPETSQELVLPRALTAYVEPLSPGHQKLSNSRASVQGRLTACISHNGRGWKRAHPPSSTRTAYSQSVSERPQRSSAGSGSKRPTACPPLQKSSESHVVNS